MGIVAVGSPGTTGSAVKMTSRNIFTRAPGREAWSDQMVIIDGSNTRDTDNSSYPYVVEAGHILAKDSSQPVTGSPSNKYMSAFYGVTTAAYSSGATTLTVGVAAATEIARRVGSTGTQEMAIVYDANQNTYETPDVTWLAVTWSAVNTTAGTLTITDLGDNIAAGALLVAEEASNGAFSNEALTELLIVTDEFGVRVTDNTDTSVDVVLERVLVGPAQINTSKIKFYDSLQNEGLQNWLKLELSEHGRRYTFSDQI